MTAAHRLGIEELEARILYSADAALLMGGGPVADVRSLDSAAATSATPSASHWLVVDRRVEDWDLTLADRQGQAGAAAALSVRFIEAGEDGQQSLADVPQGDSTEVLPWTDAQGQRWLGTSRLEVPESAEAAEAAEATVPDRWETEVRHELVIIDGGLDGASQLAMDWWSRATTACQLDVVVTDPAQDGLAQITALLSTRQNLATVHLVSHGDAGQLRLGTTTVDAALLQSRAAEVSAWRSALSDEADLLVYGCDVAQGLDGAAFVNLLAGLTGADVAASDDLTGSTDLGGDWALEYRQGVVAADSLPDAQTVSALQDWQGVLHTYTVTNLNDSGAGSLRQAIINANGHAGADTITFSTLNPLSTINLASALPQITGQVTINGTVGGAPGVALNGGNTIANGLELVAGSDGSTLRGLVLQGFTNIGLSITSSGNTIAGNYIGTDSGGNVANGNAIGINVFDGVNNVIGGTTAADRNVISGNTNIGVNITGAGSTGTVVQGNYIGTNASGSADLGNTWHGVFVNDTSGVTIGGTTAGASNVVSGNGSVSGATGITLGLSATGNLVAGNTVGLNAAGTGVLANAGIGIYVLGSANTIGGTDSAARNVVSGNATIGINLSGTDATGNTVLGNYIGTSPSGLTDMGNGEDGIQIDTGASFNTIGGLGAASRNVVAGNNNSGIAIDHAASTGNTVLGNYIGLGADGSTPLANSHNGINVSQATDTVIGSTSVAGRNVIAANTMNGVGISDATGTQVQGNYIGTDATATLSRGNVGDGVRVTGAADGTVIGGAAAGAGNFITHNTGDGVLVNTTSGSAITVIGNAITANGETGIDLGADNGVTSNDFIGDGDTGANNLQNFPVLSSASSSPAGTTIVGSLTTNASGTYRIDFYANHLGSEDGTGYGEGERYLGYTTVSSGPGTVAFTATLTSAWVNQGDRVTATATVDMGGGVYGATSEFAMNVVATTSGVVVVDTASDSIDGNTSSITALGNSRGSDQRISLREAITAVNNTANGATPDKIVFGLNGTDAHTIALASLLPSITQAVDIDGTSDDSFAAQGRQPAIVLDGSGVVTDGLQLYAGSSGSSVRGLNIQRFTQDGIDIASSNSNTVAGNWFGVGTDGVTDRGNVQGVNIWAASNNVIGGASAADRNLISGNYVGLWIGGGGTGNQVLGNYMGTTASGLAALGNETEAILIQASAGNTIGGVLAGQGNVISGNAVAGVVIGGTANEVLGNYIGLDATGQVALGNGDVGVFLGPGALNNQIGTGLSGAGNVISGNAEGVMITQGASSNKVQGNLIGLAADGVTEVGNTTVGVYLYQGGVPGTITGNIIGTDADGSNDSGERNVISGNANGIVLADADVTGNTVAGNYIGTDVTGLLDRGNTFDGVRIAAGATSNTVGGTLVAQRNVISGNGDNAVKIADEATDGNTVRGNWLGVNAAGTGSLGNGGDGVFITGGADNSVIGGTGANSGNWIASARLVGIEVDGASSGTLIQGNRVGTDLGGTANWGALTNGILLEGGATNNQIGGTAAGAGNVIAFSGQGGGVWTSGISIIANGTTGNAVLGNTVYSSVGLGLDLGLSGVTVNDTGDADTGANSLQNFPVLTTARTDGSSQLVLTGTLNSNASSYYRIEFFANTGQDATGYGEGQRYLGYANVATNGSGNATITTTLSASVAVGEYISATATKSDATYATFTDTSEFARTIAAVSSTQVVVTVDTTADTSDGDMTNLSTLLANKGADGFISLREAITAANNTANGTSADKITFSIAGTGVHTITLGSVLPTITDALVLDASTDDSFTANGSQPAIVLDGNGLSGDGLRLGATADGSTIRGLVINNFGSTSITIDSGSSGNTIAGNYLGHLDTSGHFASGLPASGYFVLVNGDNNLIGGASAADRNVFASSSNNYGIFVNGVGSFSNRITGNYFGTDATGNVAVGGTFVPISLWSSGANNQIGGNVIVDNGHTAILLNGTGTGTLVQGNRIGVSANGSLLSSVGTAVYVGGSDSTSLLNNWIAGTSGESIRVASGVTGTTIQGNRIGTDLTGTANWGSQASGIYLDGSNSLVGGTGFGQGNLIAYSNQAGGSAAGIRVTGGTGNAILGNVIRDTKTGTGGLGIDLDTVGVTANDVGDADTGVNNRQNFPVLTSAASGGFSTTVAGSLNSNASTTYRIEFFSSPAGDVSGHGEGAVYLGATTVTTNAGGNANFNATLVGASVAIGEVVTATATVDLGGGSYGSTSEFAANVVSTTAPAITVQPLAHTSEGQASGRFSVVLSTAPTADVTIAVSVDDPTELSVGTSTLTFTSANWNVTQVVTVSGVDDTIVDGDVWSTVRLASAVSADVNYNGLKPADVSVQNADNDTFNTVVVDTAADTVDADTSSIVALYANKGADGRISLREAITAANNTANGSGADRISFSIAGTGVQTITLTSDLPTLTDAIVIDGSTQTGYVGAPLIALNGNAVASTGFNLGTGSSGSTIRGLTIGNFTSRGVLVSGGSGSNLIAGNYIGTDATGLLAAGNGRWGIDVIGAGSGIVIGGTSAADRNVIGANLGFGGIALNNTQNVIVIGNYIGVGSDGVTALGNGYGVFVINTNTGSRIGGTTVAERNLIAHNSVGISVNSGTSQVAILGNSIQVSQGQGIDLGDNGAVQINDTGDADTGANSLQNFPVLTTARTDGSSQPILTGTLNSSASSHYRIEFFANTSQDATGHGEGQRYLGYANVATDASGNATISTTLSASVAVGEYLSATATKSDATYTTFTDTSEFARNIAAISSTQATVVVDTVSDTFDGDTTSLSTLLANKGADGVISLREAITAANNTANGTSADKITFAIAGTGVHTITLGSALPTITGAVVLDASTDDSFAANGSRPAIELNGNGNAWSGLVLDTGSDGSTLRGLSVVNFGTSGVKVLSTGNTLEGLYAGLRADGTTALANGYGVWVQSSGNTIGGTNAAARNVLSGNNNAGLMLQGTSNIVYGNYIGTDYTGTADVNGTTANALHSGVVISGSGGNQVGGTLTGQRNVISGNNHFGVELLAGTLNNTVAGNYIGTDVTGLVALGNTTGGARFWGSSTGNLLGGNTIAGNTGVGVQVGSGANGSLIQGNYIGVGADGSTSLGNSGTGIEVGAGSTRIGTNADGSNDAAEANTISANSEGIRVFGAGTNGTVVYGNYIGTDASGMLDRGNLGDGVIVLSTAGTTTIGGATTTHRNIISGNAGIGVHADVANVTVQGNFIGLNATGTAALGNDSYGINVGNNGTNATVRSNVVSGNGNAGVLFEVGSSGTVKGNLIGTDAAGTTSIAGNGAGIYLASGNVQVGGTAVGEGNTVSGANAQGIIVVGAVSGDAILGNVVYGNAGLAIDLGNNGVTANDSGDGDVGVNNLQNFPVLTTARTDGSSQLLLTGTLNSTATSYYRIEFFANTSQDGTGYGPGQRYLGYANVATDASGNATISTTLSASVAVGEFISATATKSNAAYSTFTDTSEFARNIAAVSSTQATVAVDTASDTFDGDTTSLSTLLANKGADGFISLREAITAANNTANGTSVDKITFAIAGTGVHTITVGTVLPSITDAVVLDASTDDSFAANANRAAIVLDGNALNASGLTLAAGSGGSTVRGFGVVDFGNYGLLIQAGSDGNAIEGNLVGLGADGSTAAANVLGGIVISSSGNTVGGTTALARNVLSGNGNAGVAVLGSNNIIIGNYLGTDATGTLDRGNWQDGVHLASGSGNRIGGTTTAERNVISGNERQGIEVFGAGTTGTLVQGNYIGTDVTGTQALGNGQGGLWVGMGTANHTIGGTAAGAGNLIAWNQGTFYPGGVMVEATASGVAILGNVFVGNTGLAIDLGMDGLTANDAGDTDTGANALQNTPLLYSADLQGADVRVRGEVNTTAGTTLRIEFFSSPLGIEDPTGYGEGAVFLGYTEVTTDGTGRAALDVTLTGVAPAAGDRVSATATVKAGASTYSATSEFSMNVPAAAPNQAPVITLTGYSGSYTENAVVVFDPGATLTDSDNPVLTGGNLTYQITANGTATDELGIRNQGTGAGQIGLSGSNVTYGGVVMGTFTGFGNGSTPLVVTFNGNATTAAVQALLRNVTYRDTSDNPSTATRSITLTVNDGHGDTSTPAVVSMAVVAVNDAPVLTNGANTVALVEGGGVSLNNSLQVRDAELDARNGGAGDYSGTTLTIIPQASPNAGDSFSFMNNNGLAHSFSTTPNQLLKNGVQIATFDNTSVAGQLTVTFTSAYGEIPTTLDLNNAIRQIVYFASRSHLAGSMVLDWTFSDGNTGVQGSGGARAAATTTTVNIAAIDDAPAFSHLDGTPTHIEGAAAVVLDADVTVTDAELSTANNFSGATLTLVRNGGASAQDLFSATGTLGALTEGGLLVVGGTTIGTVTTNSAGTLVLTFGTGATNALVNVAVQQIAYANSSSAPPASVQINWAFSDGNTGAQGTGGTLSATGGTTVTVSAVNTAPTAPAVTRYLSDLTPLAASVYTFNQDVDHGGGPIVLDGTTYAKGLGMHPGTAGDGFGYVDYAVSGATAFKAVIGVNDFQSGTYGTVRFHVYLDGVEVYTSPAVTSASDLIALDIDTTGAGTLRLAVDNGNNGNAFDHAVWAQARLEGGTVALNAVPEGAANGTVVGSVASTDPDANETLTYSLPDSAGGRFAVQATTGQLTVADGTLLDAESAGSHAIVVRVTDSGGLFRESAFTVQVSGVNEAPALGGLGGGVSFTEGASAVVLAPTASVTDPELSAADNFSGATLILARHGGANAEDQLAFDGTTVTVSGANLFVGGVQVGTYGFTGGQLDISLGSGATQVRVNTLLQNIVYWNASDTPPASVQIDWTFNDGNTGAQGVGGALATTGSVTVSTLARNDAPTGTDGRFTVAEDGAHTFSAADFGFSDVEGNAFLAVQVTTLPAAGVLQLAGVEVGAGQVVGVADLANLRFVPNPGLHGTAFTTFAFQVIDDGGTSNGGTDTAAATSTITFDVTSANDAPVLALGGTNLVANGSFEAGAVAWTGNSGVETSVNPGSYHIGAPPDGSHFAEVEGSGSSGVPSYLEQVINTEVGQTYVFSLSAVTRMDVNTLDMGMLSVDGVELGRFTTSADWSTYAVRFTATSTASTVRITSLGSQTGVGRAAGDGGGLLIDDVRVIAVDAAANFTEDAPAVLLAGGARVVDAELGLGNDFSGATLTLARNGGANAQDQFSATGTLGALAEGGALVVGSTTIGTVTANSAGTLVLTFDSNATNALVNAAMQQIVYANSSDTPPATVQIDWTFSDGNSAAEQGTGGPLTATGHTAVAITAVNDAPVLTMSASSGTYVEDDPAVSDAGAVVSDVDSADFDGGVLTYAITANGTASDELAIRDEGTGAGQIGLSGNTVTYGGVAIGTHAGFGNGSTPLVVSFNSNASASAVQALLRNITYRNTSDDPDSAVRTVQIDLTDGDGGSVTPFIGSLAITPVNDAPVITSSGVLTLVENTSTVGTVTATDVDLGAATLHYSLVGGADAALFSLDAATGVLRFLSAPDHEAPLDANADNVYQVVVRASDGQLSNTRTVAITVTDVSNALVVTTIADTVDGDTSSIEALNANAGADGRVSLREALLAANQTANALSGPDHITFSIADPLVGGAHTIVVATDLPTVTDTVVIDGSTEPDAGSGPVIVLDGAGVATTGLHVAASDTTVRGLVISRFASRGLLIDSAAANVLIAGNRIGTDVTGLLARGNGQWGIDVIGAGTGVVIGGATVADRNVIGANTGQGGLAINGTHGATVLGNYIGVGADGTTALGNATGVLLFGPTSGTRIGGTAAGEGNVIANNSGDGIGVWSASTGNALLGNLFRANAGLGIDLNWDAAVQANDVGDADAFQNHPVLTDAYRSGSDTVVDGTLNSTASTTLRIEFFSVPAASADANGHGEAPVYLGFTEVTTDGTGAASFSARLVGVTTAAGDLVTATATVKTGGATYSRTSEFSANLAVTSSAAPVLSFVSGHYNYSENAGPVVVASGASVSDADSPNFAGGRVVVYFAANGQAEDRIAVRHQGGGPGQIGLSGSTVLYGGVAIGTWAGGTDGATPLIITLNAAATPTATQALLRNITYANVSDNPLTAVRTMAGYLEDGAGGTSNTVTGTIGVLPSNDAPLAHAGGSYAIAEGDSLVLDASASSDLDDVVLTYAWDLDGNGVYGETGEPTAAGATVDWATLAALGLNDSGSHTIGVRVTDAQGASSVATATLVIADRAPVLTVGGTGRVTAGQPYTLTLSASDAGADTITAWTIDWGDGTVMTYAGNPGSVVHTYTRSGTTFSVLASVVDEDGTHAQDLLQAHQVLVDNAAPVLTSNGGGASATVSLAENTTTVTTVTASDIDQPVQTLAFSIAGGADAARFTIDAATGALSFVTSPDHEGPSDANADNVYDVTVQVSDGSLTASQSIAVTVTDVNDNTPAISSGSAVSMAENTTAVTTVAASDADQPAQTLTFSITGGADAALFTIDSATGALSFRTAPDYEAPTDANADNVYDVTVQVSDGSLTATQAVAVTVTDVNDNTPAITSSSAASVAENTTAVMTMTASDADQPTQTLTFSITGGADGDRFTIDAATGALSFRSAPDYEAPSDANADNVYDVMIQVSDGSLTASQPIAVTVTGLNDNTPTITSDGAVSVAENAAAVTVVTASDADQPTQTLTFSITGGADGDRFTIDALTGALSFRTVPDYEAPTDANADNVYDVTVQVSDGSLTATQAVAVTVTDVNDNTPVITSSSAASVAENTTAVMTMTASDADQPAQTLTFSITGGADGDRFTIDAATGALSFRFAPDYEAPSDANADNVYDVMIQVGDGSLTTSQPIAVTVTGLNDNTPTITSDGAVSVAENAAAVTVVTASDADQPAQTLTFSITGGADAARFTIDAATGVLSFRTAPDYEAPADANVDNVYDVTVQVSDGSLTASQSIAVTVTDLNDNTPTTTSGDAVSVAENTTAVMTVTASDADRPVQTLTFSITGGADAARFTIDAATGALSFVVAPDHEAPSDTDADNVYEVTVQVNDGGLGTNQSIAVTVNPVNDNVPQFTSDWHGVDVSAMAPEGERWSATVPVVDADLPAQGLHFDISGGADAALFELDPVSGLLTFRPVADFEVPQDANRDNAYEVEVTVGDGEFTVHRTLTLLIANVNEAPVLLTSQVSVEQGGRVTLDASMLQSSDPDSDATALVYTVSDVRAGTFVRAAAPDQAIERFTQAEVLAGEVVFVQSGEGTEATRFDLTVSDGGWVVGPHRVSVQVQPEAPASMSGTGLSPTLGAGFAAAIQDNNLIDEPLTGVGDGRVSLDQIMIEIAGADRASTYVSPPEEPANSDSPVSSTSTPSTTVMPVKAAAVSPMHRIGPMPDLLPGARATPFVGIEPSSVVTDLSRLPVSDLLVMLDVPIDLSGFIQDRMVLLQWGSLEERSKAAVESARQQHGGDLEPTLRWDSGETVQAGGMALSVGLVFWATRASGLVASLAAVAPPWRQFDPLPVLSVHAPRQPEGTEVEWLDTDIPGSLADLAEDILDHRT